MNRMSEEAMQRLLSRREVLRRLHERNTASAQEIDQTAEPDWPDRAKIDESARVLATLREAERKEIDDIDAALVRITAGTYGRCQACGGAIGSQRLRALPEARLCLACTARGRDRDQTEPPHNDEEVGT
jgi:DnaK suppressor protein